MTSPSGKTAKVTHVGFEPRTKRSQGFRPNHYTNFTNAEYFVASVNGNVIPEAPEARTVQRKPYKLFPHAGYCRAQRGGIGHKESASLQPGGCPLTSREDILVGEHGQVL